MVKFDWKAIFASRVLWIAIAAIVGLMLLGWMLSGVESCNWNRQHTKQKEAVNAQLNEIKQVEANINAQEKLKQDLVANVRRDAKDHIDAQTFTNQAMQETDEQRRKMQEAANLPRNVNAAELEKLLEGL